MFHVGFKGLAIFSFLFLNAFIGMEIITFVVVVLFAAFDFWTVKNVTGRLLVNLRWHSEIDEFGQEKWIYESDTSSKSEETAVLAGDPDALEKARRRQEREGGKTDRWVFWLALYLTPVIWSLLLLM